MIAINFRCFSLRHVVLAATCFGVICGFSASTTLGALVPGQWIQLNFTNGWNPPDKNEFNYYIDHTNNTNSSLPVPDPTDMIDSEGNLVPGLSISASAWSGNNWDGASDLAPWPAGDGSLTPAAAAGKGDSVWRRDEHINFWWDSGDDSTITVHGLDPNLKYNVYYYSKHSSPVGEGEFHTLTVNGDLRTTEPRGTRFADPDEDLLYQLVELNANNDLEMVWGTAPNSGYNPVVSAIVIQAVVPEPSSIALLAIAFGGLVCVARRRI